MHLMKRKGLKPIKTQVLVHSIKLKIKAFIDIVAVNSKGEVIVVELKSTRTSMGEHRKLYQKDTDIQRRVMRNNVKDTEEHHHFLQAGFGALGLQHTYSCIATMSLKVRACILVSCADGAQMHNVPETFMMPSQFRVDTLLANPNLPPQQRPVKSPIIKPWPTDTTGFAQQLSHMGFNNMVPQSLKSEYAVLSHDPPQAGARLGLAVCLGQPLDSLSPRQLTDLKRGLAQKCKSVTKTRRRKKAGIYRGLDPSTGLARKCKPEVTTLSLTQNKIPLIIYPGRNRRWEIWASSHVC